MDRWRYLNPNVPCYGKKVAQLVSHATSQSRLTFFFFWTSAGLCTMSYAFLMSKKTATTCGSFLNPLQIYVTIMIRRSIGLRLCQRLHRYFVIILRISKVRDNRFALILFWSSLNNLWNWWNSSCWGCFWICLVLVMWLQCSLFKEREGALLREHCWTSWKYAV